MLTGKMGAPDRPRQSVGRLRTQGRGQLARKASILEGPHPGTQIFIPLFPKYLFSSMCQSWCQAQQTQQGMKDKNPCLRGVYIPIGRQENKIDIKYISCWMTIKDFGEK